MGGAESAFYKFYPCVSTIRREISENKPRRHTCHIQASLNNVMYLSVCKLLGMPNLT
jgi:hypothetical protein